MIWNWYDIAFQLLEDPMIECGGFDGLMDANNLLHGLFGMSELMYNEISNEFICRALNAAIDGRNRYTYFTGREKIPYVTLKDDKFIWEYDSYE